MKSKLHNSCEFEVLADYLKQNNWTVEPVSGKVALRGHEDTGLCSLTYYFQLFESHNQFVFYISPDLELEAEFLPAATEYITRVNCGMRIGNFEIDYAALRVSFRSSVDYTKVGLTPGLIEGVIQPAMAAFREFFPGLAPVISGILTPLQALEESNENGAPE